MATLYWPGNGTFSDPEKNVRVTTEGLYDVPDDREDRYVERGWSDPDDEEAEVESAEDQRVRTAVQNRGRFETTEGTPEDEGDAEGEDDRDGSEVTAGEDVTPDETPDSDADALIDGHWQNVVNRIEDGDADHFLDEATEAEKARDSPRSSVLDALDDRRVDVTSGGVSADSARDADESDETDDESEDE